MEEKIRILAEDAFPFLELQRFEVLKKKMETDPPPVRVSLDGWRGEKEKFLQGQISSIVDSIINTASREIEPMWNSDLFKERVWEVFQRQPVLWSWPFIQQKYLEPLSEKMEEATYKFDMQMFESRLDGLKHRIEKWTGKLPKPFSPDLVNKDKRFPIDRIGFVDNKPFDKWLTESLDSKTPIFFDTPEWKQGLVKYYREVYVPASAEEEARGKPIVKQPEVKPEVVFSGGPPLSEMLEHGFIAPPEEEPMRNVSRIYKKRR